jgi:protein SCO1/2
MHQRVRFPIAASRGGIATLASLVLVASLACQPRPELPDYGAAPQFSLTDQSDQPFASADTTNRVVLVDFIYTTCTDICPLLSARMRDLQERLKSEDLFGSQVLLLSITVDPQRDTPAVLAEYGERFHADPAGWRFLTGDREILRHLLHDGFKVGFPTGAKPRADDPGWLHTNRFVLIDRAGHVRGYPTLGDRDLDAILDDVRALLA